MAHAGGRPTDYTPELLEKARHYLSNFKELGDVVPQIAGLAITLGIARETLYRWESDEDKAEFSDIVNRIRANQERNLANGGLDGSLNPAITKLMLAKHGFAERQQTELTVPEGVTFNMNFGMPSKS